MNNRYCPKCKKTTRHVRQNSAGEVAGKVLLGVMSMGMSIGITPTVYECVKCGNEKEE